MKYLKFWLRKEVSKIYEKLRIKGKNRAIAEDEIEDFVNENRKRIQDIELLLKDIVKSIDQNKNRY